MVNLLPFKSTTGFSYSVHLTLLFRFHIFTVNSPSSVPSYLHCDAVKFKRFIVHTALYNYLLVTNYLHFTMYSTLLYNLFLVLCNEALSYFEMFSSQCIFTQHLQCSAVLLYNMLLTFLFRFTNSTFLFTLQCRTVLFIMYMIYLIIYSVQLSSDLDPDQREESSQGAGTFL
jgi:hypothetical protein